MEHQGQRIFHVNHQWPESRHYKGRRNNMGVEFLCGSTEDNASNSLIGRNVLLLSLKLL